MNQDNINMMECGNFNKVDRSMLPYRRNEGQYRIRARYKSRESLILRQTLEGETVLKGDN